MRDPASICGDLPLSPADRRAYIEFHRRRNLLQAAASAGIPTQPGPRARFPNHPGSSPSRVAVNMFFTLAAREARARFARTPITLLDAGCGRGNAIEPFVRAGLRGRYFGIDISRHPHWTHTPAGEFSRELILADINHIAPSSLPPADVVLTSTSLEHIRDDAAAVRLLADRTRPGGFHAHAVPAEAALPLYGAHGWRQYSPIDLASLFPGSTILRYGGPLSNAWHRTTITKARGLLARLAARRPGLAALLRDSAMLTDHLLGDAAPTLYGVLWEPPAIDIGHRDETTRVNPRAA
ncbi:hypothetical protein PHYC_00966 [Phycisphaerales bacterium]|nr:hypothetical protein PHYC_00966 [Phycisphaerales bacterium]